MTQTRGRQGYGDVMRPDEIFRGARRALTDPRLVGMAAALPRTAYVLGRSAVRGEREGYGPMRLSPGLAGQMMLDEILISVMQDPKLFPHGEDYERAGQEIRRAFRMWSQNGWLADPESYHFDPPTPAPVVVTRERVFDQRFEHVSFGSAYRPHAGEPGDERWNKNSHNRVAHAYVLRHADPGRPWLVCLHGFGMGRPLLDLRAFRASYLHWDLGVNIATVVLPMHGPRQEPGKRRGEGFMSIDLLDSVHGMAQAASDTRSVISWIRSTDPEARVGVYGISLGGFVSALVASLEEGLACAIAGIPATDIPDLYRRHSPRNVRRKAYEHGALGPDADAVHSVVSPLVIKAKVAPDRRYIFAGVGDRMSTAGQARRLWEHWGKPRMEWYPGGHIGFFFAGAVQDFVVDALSESGLVSPPPGRVGRRTSSSQGPSLTGEEPRAASM